MDCAASAVTRSSFAGARSCGQLAHGSCYPNRRFGQLRIAGVFVDISPIKFSPITGMLKWIGRKLTGEGGRGAAGAGGSRVQKDVKLVRLVKLVKLDSGKRRG